MTFVTNIYHRMPPATRTVAASLRGYYLSWWRYDRRTEDRVAAALERENWDATKWRDWQEERLSKLLWRAANEVPYYRNLWSQRRQNGDRRSYEYLENWPILEKPVLRRSAYQFVAEDCNRSMMFHDHTSGTTGTSLDIWLTAETVKEWYALHEARCRRWNGVSRKDRWAIFGGQLVTEQVRRQPPFWVWNAGLNQLYMSAYHIAPDLVKYYLDALSKYRVRYLLGYPSAIYGLAYEAIKQKIEAPKLDVVIANAEPLYQYQRDAIAEAFSCPVRETYGMAEIAAAASECDAAGLHMWPEAGLIEIDRETLENDGSGDLICTGLLNQDMPLIRYRVGDIGKLSEDHCTCGRRLPMLGGIEGRRDDVLLTSDGRRVGRLDPVFKSDLPVVEAQVVQRTYSSVVVRYVADRGFDRQTKAELASRICDRMGDIHVGFEEVDEIPRTSRGKFKAVICEIPVDQRHPTTTSLSHSD